MYTFISELQKKQKHVSQSYGSFSILEYTKFSIAHKHPLPLQLRVLRMERLTKFKKIKKKELLNNNEFREKLRLSYKDFSPKQNSRLILMRHRSFQQDNTSAQSLSTNERERTGSYNLGHKWGKRDYSNRTKKTLYIYLFNNSDFCLEPCQYLWRKVEIECHCCSLWNISAFICFIVCWCVHSELGS